MEAMRGGGGGCSNEPQLPMFITCLQSTAGDCEVALLQLDEHFSLSVQGHRNVFDK